MYINRSVMILTPRKPMLEWAARLSSYEAVSEVSPLSHDESSVYLIPECENAEEFKLWLAENHVFFFEQELFDWCIDEDAWPKELTFEKFNEWFFCVWHSTVTDVPDEPIVRLDY